MTSPDSSLDPLFINFSDSEDTCDCHDRASAAESHESSLMFVDFDDESQQYSQCQSLRSTSVSRESSLLFIDYDGPSIETRIVAKTSTPMKPDLQLSRANYDGRFFKNDCKCHQY